MATASPESRVVCTRTRATTTHNNNDRSERDRERDYFFLSTHVHLSSAHALAVFAAASAEADNPVFSKKRARNATRNRTSKRQHRGRKQNRNQRRIFFFFTLTKRGTPRNRNACTQTAQTTARLLAIQPQAGHVPFLSRTARLPARASLSLSPPLSQCLCIHPSVLGHDVVAAQRTPHVAERKKKEDMKREAELSYPANYQTIRKHSYK